MNVRKDIEKLQELYPGMPITQLPLELQAALPVEKDDMEAVERIRKIGYPAIAPILPHLITWMEDMNWPIAGKIADELVSIGQPMVPYIQKVLKSGEYQWKYYVLEYLVKRLDMTSKKMLWADIEKISQQKDPAGAFEIAVEILKETDNHK